MIEVKANIGNMIENAAVPKPPKFDENIDIDITLSSISGLRVLTSFVVRNISEVSVQITKVSKKISNTPQSPCFTGSRVSEAE